MQQPVSENPRPTTSPRGWWLPLACLLTLPGCGGDSIQNPRPDDKRFTGISLTVRAADPSFAHAVTPIARAWAARTGAAVEVRVGPMAAGDDTDVGIIPARDLGTWAERGELAAVPAALRGADHPFQWSALLPAYREHLIEWGGQARAVPLAGDGYVVVYRADRLADPTFAAAFRKRHGRDPAAPTTWEEFTDLAAAFAELDGKPSLPPLLAAPLVGPGVADVFFRVAACYDRPALNDPSGAKGGTLGALSFQFDAATGAPRLNSPGFAAAADWLAGLAARKALPPPGTRDDPTGMLGDGRASLAILSLVELARLPKSNKTRAVSERFAVTALPGTRSFVRPETGQLGPAPAGNYVPYFSGGRVGVVRTRCASPEAAFDLLAEIGGPARSLELLGTPGLGVGPFRVSHLERDRLLPWLAYGFDADRSKLLQDAMRQYVRVEVRNAAYGLRGPDREPLDAAAAAALEKVAAGAAPADAGLGELRGAWDRIDAKTPAETRARWRKNAAGLP